MWRLRSSIRHHGLRPSLVALVAAGLIRSFGCGGGNPGETIETSTARHGGTLYVDAPQLSELRSLDPVEATDINTASIASAIYEGLLGYTPDPDADLVPALAESWDVSPDGRLWTFRLRRGVRFQDDPCFSDGRGREVTAADVVYSLRRGLGRVRSPLSLERYLETSSPEHAARAIEEIAPDELRVTLARPARAFAHALANPAAWVVPREAVERYGDEFARHPVGTGPFRLASWDTLTLILVRNEHYWRQDAGGRLPYLDAVVARRAFSGHLRAEMAELLDGGIHVLFLTGDLDWTGLESLSHFMASRRVREVRLPKMNTIFLGFNLTRDGPWSRSRELRQAVDVAIRRPAGGELLSPAAGLLPPNLDPCAQPTPPRPQDLARGRQLLRQAGFPGGRGLPPLRLGLLGRSAYFETSVLEPLEELGIRVDLQLRPWASHMQAVRRGEYEMFRAGWIADYPDAENFFGLFHSTSPNNNTGYADAEYDRLLAKLRDPRVAGDERRGLCQRLDAILDRDRPAVFLYHEQAFYLVRPEVRNVEAIVNPLERKFYEYVWLADDTSE